MFLITIIFKYYIKKTKYQNKKNKLKSGERKLYIKKKNFNHHQESLSSHILMLWGLWNSILTSYLCNENFHSIINLYIIRSIVVKFKRKQKKEIQIKIQVIMIHIVLSSILGSVRGSFACSLNLYFLFIYYFFMYISINFYIY